MKQVTLTMALLSSTVAACAEQDPDDAPTVEVARLESAAGTLRMFAEPDGSVALAEKTTLHRTPAEALIADQGATALEVYLALAPAGSEVPEALWGDHRATRGAAEPRTLALPLAGATDVVAFDDCNSADWPGFLAGVQASYSYKYRRWVSASDGIWTKSTSEDTGRRRFDACAADNFGGNTATVAIGHKDDGDVGYSWLALVEDDVGVGERFWYSSQYGDPDWQMQVTEPGAGVTRSVGLGRAESPPLGIED